MTVTESPAIDRAKLRRQVSSAIRAGRCDEAQEILSNTDWPHDAEWLNLMGAVLESKHQWKAALRCYGQAMRADRNYLPAQHNMRRLYELYTFGHTDEHLLLGDERPALALLIAARGVFRQRETTSPGTKR